jgi:hypothetical protein
MTGTFNGSSFNGHAFNGAAAGTAVPLLLVAATFKAITISPPSPPSPWSVDPQRTQELPPSYGS